VRHQMLSPATWPEPLLRAACGDRRAGTGPGTPLHSRVRGTRRVTEQTVRPATDGRVEEVETAPSGGLTGVVASDATRSAIPDS
jgi:hypothetical protein